jgi:hypothetical protein|tara:strand:- start:169 stop:1272 length:1104 start_codon:yes stop_codon:yes gene_type:complete
MEEHVSQSINFKNGIGHLPLTEGWGINTTSVNATLFGPGGVWIRDVADDGIDFVTDSKDPDAKAYVYWVGSFPQPDGGKHVCCQDEPVDAKGTQEFVPGFDVDYNDCGDDPIVSAGGVSFGSKGNVHSGRVCSQNGYINIATIDADIDLSGLNQYDGWTGDWVNAAFYAVTSKSQPLKGGYCDAEYTAVPFCNEIDFLETNGNKMFQHTLHLATAKSGPQRWEVAFTEAANTPCWNWDQMIADKDPGVHNLVDVINVNDPFHMQVKFAEDYTNMIITVSQNDKSAVVFNMDDVPVAGSATLDMSMLKDAMAVGWWLTPSYHASWSPGTTDPTHWYKDSGGACSHGALCGEGGGWSLSNIKITAESQI